ncbi:ABC transporter substrate-binding protein [Brachybacterium sp. AOP42-C2-15]|uniref:ABC transporter substrate-binding protein n=1 Tax=unclassified Brachybacterium TaxID=2623841 RepID=UPI00403323A9
MKRRTFTGVAAAAFGASVLAACGGSGGGGSDDEPVGTVTMWMFPVFPDSDEEVEFWGRVKEAFEAEYPDAVLDLQIQPWANRSESLSSAVAAGTQPDVVYLNPDYVAQYGAMGALEPVDERLDSVVLGALRQSAVDGSSYDGILYGLPILQGVSGNIWNMKILDELGIEAPPTTWDELMDVAPDIKGAGHFVTQYSGHLEETMLHSFYPYLWQAGGEVLNEDQSAAAFNSAEGVTALERIKALVAEEYVPREPLTSRVTIEQSEFAAGNMAFMTVAASVAVTAQPEEDLVVGPPLDGGGGAIGTGTVGTFCPMANSDSPGAVTAFLNFFAQSEFLEEFLRTGYFYSATDEIDSLYEPDSLLGQEEALLDMITPGPLHPAAREFYGALAPNIQDVLLNDADPQSALEASATEVDAIIARNG